MMVQYFHWSGKASRIGNLQNIYIWGSGGWRHGQKSVSNTLEVFAMGGGGDSFFM